MLPIILMTAPEIAKAIADRARRRRLDVGLTQLGLADRAGMSLSSLRRFERTGRVALLSLVRIAMALHALDGFGALFPDQPTTLDELLEKPQRQRGYRE